MNNTKKLFFTVILILIIFAMIEATFFAGGRVLQSKWGMWKVPYVQDDRKEPLSYDQYIARRDPVLGWPSPMQFGKDLDVNGAQYNPFFPEGGKTNNPCISLYGDSFTQGGDTSGLKNNWGNALSEALDCYVANYGMGGYGNDQAYIRFIENEADSSPIVIFGYHPGDTLRNLTRIRDLENYNKSYALKPRFIIDPGTDKLTMIAIPNLSEDEYLRIIGERNEMIALEHENLQPDGPGGVVKLEFPYTISVIRNLISFYGFRSRIANEPQWKRFLQPGHSLHGLEITVAITRDFVDLAKQRGKQALVLILPHPEDFEYFHKSGDWPYRHVIERYKRSNILFEDFGPYLIDVAKTAERAVHHYIGPTGHYNDEGNAELAMFTRKMLAKHKLMPETATP